MGLSLCFLVSIKFSAGMCAGSLVSGCRFLFLPPQILAISEAHAASLFPQVSVPRFWYPGVSFVTLGNPGRA